MESGDRTKPRAQSRGAERTPIAARLTVVHPRAVRRTIELTTTSIVIGRTAEVAVPDPTLSKQHASIEWDPAGHHRCLDLESRNGTTIDGDAATHVLRDGSVVRMGDVLAVYECWRTEPVRDDAVSREAVFGDAIAIVGLRARIPRAAVDTAPVLIIGDTGTGKEFVAAELHRLSRRTGPYVQVNCAALSSQLIESQLFGHERGAFSGATVARPGIFRESEGGTVLLDEIGELPLDLQPKLLRAIQEGEVLAVGSARPIKVDVRVLAATNRDLSRAVDQGTFRRDLHARLAMWELRVPPLTDRRVDVLAWIDRLDRRFRAGAEPPSWSCDAAETALLAAWPDNLRGIDRLVHALAEHPARPVECEDLPAWVGSRPPPEPAGRAVPTREEFVAAFERLDGRVSALARELGRDRKQIYRWIAAYGLRSDPD